MSPEIKPAGVSQRPIEQKGANLYGLYEGLRQILEKASCTGHLMRAAKGILSNWPGFTEKAATAAYLHTPWISIEDYLIRFDYVGYNNEALRIDKIIDRKTSEAESIQILYKGFESEEGFDGITYSKGIEMGGEPFYDEETRQTSFIGESSEPLVGEDALPKAKEILGEILDKIIEEFEKKEKGTFEVSLGTPFSLDRNFVTKRGPEYSDVKLDIDGARDGVITITQIFMQDESKLWEFHFTIKDLTEEDFNRYEVFILYNGKKYKATETDIDEVSLKRDGESHVHFFNWVDESGEELELDSNVDIFSQIKFLIEYSPKS